MTNLTYRLWFDSAVCLLYKNNMTPQSSNQPNLVVYGLTQPIVLLQQQQHGSPI